MLLYPGYRQSHLIQPSPILSDPAYWIDRFLPMDLRFVLAGHRQMARKVHLDIKWLSDRNLFPGPSLAEHSSTQYIMAAEKK